MNSLSTAHGMDDIKLIVLRTVAISALCELSFSVKGSFLFFFFWPAHRPFS
jgi:hypothetical protein